MPRRLLVLATVTLAAASLAACGGTHHASPELAAAQRFLDALGRGDAAAAAATSDPATAEPILAESLKGLGPGATGSLRATSADDGSVDFRAAWTIPGASDRWTYQGRAHVEQRAGAWTVDWSPADIAPGLGAHQHLQAQRVQPARAALEDDSGRPLFTRTAVVRVGIEPSLVTDLHSLATTLASTLSISAHDILASVKAAPSPQAFVDVITLRKPAYEAVRAIIHPLPGTVFRTGTELLAPTTRFAQPLLGHVGPATAEIVKASGGRVQADEQTGLDGLQRVFDKQLAGTDGVDVYAADPNGTLGAKLGSAGRPKPGTAVRLTLDRATQQAADAALQNVSKQASIVALQPSTGRLLAVANSASTRGDIALAGQYPPGSTYKIVTATAALADGTLTADTREACPATKTVDGRVFVNEDRFDLGTVSLRTAFAMSCNTTFMTLGMALPPTALPDAARRLGLGATWQLPVESFSGSVPPPAGLTEKAADAIGQGRVLASPLAMAEVAAAVQSGRPIAPTLTGGEQSTEGPALPPKVTAALQDMMRATVTSGRAKTLSDLPGGVAGKTGTAEYGTATPPRSHGWFAGYRGDLAFAVFVYDGQTSKVAVRLTHEFLAALP